MTHTARIAGLSIQSEIALPGLISDESINDALFPGHFKPSLFPIGLSAVDDQDQYCDLDRKSDVVVRKGTVPTGLDNGQALGPSIQYTADQLLINVPTVARFLLKDGRSVTVEPAAHTADQDLGIFLVGTVLGMLLHQRGALVLHASAVEVDGQAVLFCGVSGSGKSTLAALLSSAGYGFINDDVSAIFYDEHGAPVVQSDCRSAKLWHDAIEHLDMQNNVSGRVRSMLEKYYVEPKKISVSKTPVKAIYFLAKNQLSSDISIKPLNNLDALTQIRLNIYRPRIQSALGRDQKHLLQKTAFLKHVKAFQLTRPWSTDRFDDIQAALQDHWSKLQISIK